MIKIVIIVKLVKADEKMVEFMLCKVRSDLYIKNSSKEEPSKILDFQLHIRVNDNSQIIYAFISMSIH